MIRPLPLRWHARISTRSPEEAYESMSSRYPTVRDFSPALGRDRFHFAANAVHIGRVLLVAGTSTGFSFREGREDRLTFTAPLARNAAIRAGAKALAVSSDAVLINGADDFCASYEPGFSGVFLTISHTDLRDHLALHSQQRGHDLAATRLLSGKAAKVLRAVMKYSVDTIDALGSDSEALLSRFGLEEHLATAISNALEFDTGISEIRQPADLSDRLVRRARDFIEANAHTDIGVTDVARELGVSVRTLQLAFRRRLHLSPYSFIQEQRLRLAHEALTRAGPGDTVRTIAQAHGFMHPGRFSGMIQALTGNTASEILRKARAELSEV